MSSSPPSEAFNIVLLYEHCELNGKVLAAYSQLRRELGTEFSIDFRTWRIDVAQLAEFAVQADRDIAAADVIFVAVRGNQSCPPAFRRWREEAGSDRGARNRAIVAIVNATDEPTPAGESWNSFLRGGATQIHPEIFIWEPVAVADCEPDSVELNADAQEPLVGVPQMAFESLGIAE